MKTVHSSASQIEEKRSLDPAKVRKTILQMLHRSKASHLGTNMSIVEMLIASYASVDRKKIAAKHPSRSRIIVSKGHCAAATYAVMAHYGLLAFSLLESYHSDGSLLAGHVSHAVPGVEHSTGALGHGLPVAVGCALGLRAKGFDDALVFALLGDGEIQEGSVWEALMLARHHNLNNLITMIDNNGISSITRTDNVINMNPLRERLQGFGFQVHEVDGHNMDELGRVIATLRLCSNIGVILCNTVKGKGVPFAEGEPIWHYRSLNDELYEKAINSLQSGDVSV